MTPEQFARLESLFGEALDLPAAERPAFVEASCTDDPLVRERLEALLAEEARGTAALGTPPLERLAEPSRPGGASDLLERIGDFEILETLGSGGMGTVYLALQDTPRRRVAVKVIRGGFMNEELRVRFRREAELLGRLQHVGIAQVYEAGEVEAEHGPVPFLAMEYVEGLPLSQHVEQAGLNVEERLHLFVKLCDAVQHAHQKGVLHRDLKPDNILVAEGGTTGMGEPDRVGQPKILDFGIARAMDTDVQRTTLRTEAGQLLGTLPYMSPEQVAGDPDEIDGRSDIYALGVILFQLLAGRLPIELAGLPIHEAIRRVHGNEPTQLASIDTSYRGDLDTIASHALEKEKARRYASPAELAADVRRYLTHEPIAARPPSTFYQLSKFARRNKILVTSAAAVFLALVVGLIGTLFFLFESRAKTLAVEEAQGAAQLEYERAQAINAFLVEDLLGQTQVGKAGIDVRVIDLLDSAAATVEERFGDRPIVAAELFQTLANAYHATGNLLEAAPLSRRAFDLFRVELGPRHATTLIAASFHAGHLGKLGRSEDILALVEPLIEDASAELGPNDPDVLVLRSYVGYAHATLGRTSEALAELREVLALQREFDHTGDADHNELITMQYLFHALGREGKLEEALEVNAAICDRASASHSHDEFLIYAPLRQARLLAALGRPDEALESALEGLSLSREAYPDIHPGIGSYLRLCAEILQDLGRHAEAVPYAQEAWEILDELYRQDQWEIEQVIDLNLQLHVALRDRAEEELWRRRALPIRLRVAGPGELDNLAGKFRDLARLLREQGRDEEADGLVQAYAAAAAEHAPPGHGRRARYLGNLGRVLVALQRIEEAEALLLESAAALEDSDILGEDAPAILGALADLYELWELPDEAAAWRSKIP